MSDTRHMGDGAGLMAAAIGFCKLISGEFHNMFSAACAAAAGFITAKLLAHAYTLLFGKRGRKKKSTSYDPT